MPRAMLVAAVVLLCAGRTAQAQSHDHAQMSAGAPRASQPGEAAYAAIAEIVRLLQADPNTDWSRVDLEQLRRHLADMHEVTINSAVAQKQVAGGFEAAVTGAARTAAAIQRMARAHARATAQDTRFEVAVTDLPNGARVRVVARQKDERAAQMLRGLGFIGWLTLEDHHAPHHLMIARGTTH